MPVTILPLDRWLIPQLEEVIQNKMNRGDLQAEFELKNSKQQKYIKVNLKQLFIVIQALLRVPGEIALEEINYTDNKEENDLTRQLFILKDNIRIKDITDMGASWEDIQIRNQAKLIEHQWNKE